MSSNDASLPGAMPESPSPPPTKPPAATSSSSVPPVPPVVSKEVESQVAQVADAALLKTPAQAESDATADVKGDANSALRQAASEELPSTEASQVENLTTAGSVGQAENMVVADAKGDANAALSQEATAMEKKALNTPEMKHLRAELQKLVTEMNKNKYIFTRLAQWFQRLQLVMNITIALLAAITASGHSHISAQADPDPQILNTFVVVAMSVQGVIIGINSYLDFSKVKSESQTCMKGYNTILSELQTILAEPVPTENQLRNALLNATKTSEKLLQALGYTPPKWVIKEAEGVQAEAAKAQTAASKV